MIRYGKWKRVSGESLQLKDLRSGLSKILSLESQS
jgi:hypothetical protein